MATVKEFQNKQTGVRVYIHVNHSDKTLRSRMIDAWANGYTGESNGKQILAWMRIVEDIPVPIPCASVTVTARFKEQEETTVLNRKGYYQNHFAVTVKKNGISETFDFHGSIVDSNAGIVNLSDIDKISAFYCFVQDALSGLMPFKDFKSEMGFDDCCEAHRVWKLCQDVAIKAQRLGLGDLYDLSNKLQEAYPDVV